MSEDIGAAVKGHRRGKERACRCTGTADCPGEKEQLGMARGCRQSDCELVGACRKMVQLVGAGAM